MKAVKNLWSWVFEPLLVLAILAGGFWMALGVSNSGEEMETVPDAPELRPTLRYQEALVSSAPVEIRGHGTLRPRTRIDLVPQVGGRIVMVHPELRPGGTFAGDEVLFEIERTDYALRLEQKRSEVMSTRSKLAIEKAEASAALAEWSSMRGDREPPALVGRKPQISEAEAAVRAAESSVRLAELDLERTAYRLPYATRLLSISLDIGQVINAGQSVGTVYGTDILELPVPIESSDLRWLSASDDGNVGSATHAQVILELGGRKTTVTAELVRFEGEVDPRSRQLMAVIEIRTSDIPSSASSASTFLRPGLFAEVIFEGQTLESITRLPRSAVRAGPTLWVYEEGKLRIRTPEIVHSSATTVYLRGLQQGERVITGQLDYVVDGMAVNLEEAQ